MSYTYTPAMDRIVQRRAKWFWYAHLQRTSVQCEDAVQMARLWAIENQIEQRFLSRQVAWMLSRRIFGNKKDGYPKLHLHLPVEYVERETPISIQELSEDQHRTLIENLWVVGYPNTYEILWRYMHGETKNTIDSNLIKRATATLRKAFPTLQQLLSPEPAICIPTLGGRKALRLFKEKHDENFPEAQRAFLARQL